MKRILSLLAVFAIVCSLTVPAFASDDIPSLPVDLRDYDWYLMFEQSNGYILNAGYGDIDFYIDKNPGDSNQTYVYYKNVTNFNYRQYFYKFETSSWIDMGSKSLGTSGGFNPTYCPVVYVSESITDIGGGVYSDAIMPPVPECDGSTCPATDLNHDNICDDCGQVLTMSLRSSLWEYAQSVVSNGMSIFDSDYWLITDNGENGYKIYISSVPFKYISSSDSVVSTGVVQRTEVYDTSDGSYSGGTSWASKQPNTALDVGTPVATSHPIEGFFPIPLWMEMDRLTQGEMTEMGQTMGGTMRILVPCGVGCLALLAVLKLFGKRSLIFRN